jgi:DNA-binding CsgD family transcriptional regulator
MEPQIGTPLAAKKLENLGYTMITFFAYSIALLSSAFSIGGVSYLYMHHRTRILRLVLLFLLSLLSLSIGFWFGTSFFTGTVPGLRAFTIIHWIFQFLGSGLNIVVVPFLISALISLPIPARVIRLLWIWDGIFVLSATAWFLTPEATPFASVVQLTLSIQQILTISGSLVFMAVGMVRIRRAWWWNGMVTFFIISAVFLLLLILDILISIVPLESLAAVDNLSLPLYLIGLTIGTFIFASKYLSRDAMIDDGKLTKDCIDFYHLTPREVEIIEALISGGSNKQIAEWLFISVKTVENHLYNIYQKTDTSGRLQLLHSLQSWGSE